MSHFLTLVLIDSAEANVEEKVRELLRPYFDGGMANFAKNPKVKCDGFIIGGRFDGQIFGDAPVYNLKPGEFQRRYGMDVIKAEDNIRRAAEVPETLIPYAILTPEGRWFDCENKSQADWRREAKELLNLYGEHLAVAVDCHC